MGGRAVPSGGSPGGLSPRGLAQSPRGLAQSPRGLAQPSPTRGAGGTQRVRRLHEKLFYRPLLGAVARLPSDAARLTPEAARARLEALGYRDPTGALRHIEALTSGLRRRAAIQRTLLPGAARLVRRRRRAGRGAARVPPGQRGAGGDPLVLRLLRDETKAAERIAYVLASSRYAAGLLLRAPEAVAIFADDAELVPPAAAALRSEMMAAAKRHDTDAEQAAVAVRSLRRRELLRVAAANVLGLIGLAETGEALTAITTAAIDAVLAVTITKIETELREPLPTRFAVIAMGRYGGHEMGFGSDADVIFVHDPYPGLDAEGDRKASDAAQAVGAGLRRAAADPGPGPAAARRRGPAAGRAGLPLVRSLAACRRYYERRAAPWEAQALLRAEPAVGDGALGAEFIAMADELRYQPGGISEQAVREIRRVKARVEAERIPRGADRALQRPARPRRPVRRGVDGAALAAPPRLRRAEAAHHQDAGRPRRRSGRGPGAGATTPRRSARMAARRPDQERGHADPGPPRRHAARKARGTDRRRPPPRLQARRRERAASTGRTPRRRRSSRTTAAPPAAPAPVMDRLFYG